MVGQQIDTMKEPKDDRGSYIIKWKAVKKWEKGCSFLQCCLIYFRMIEEERSLW